MRAKEISKKYWDEIAEAIQNVSDWKKVSSSCRCCQGVVKQQVIIGTCGDWSFEIKIYNGVPTVGASNSVKGACGFLPHSLEVDAFEAAKVV